MLSSTPTRSEQLEAEAYRVQLMLQERNGIIPDLLNATKSVEEMLLRALRRVSGYVPRARRSEFTLASRITGPAPSSQTAPPTLAPDATGLASSSAQDRYQTAGLDRNKLSTTPSIGEPPSTGAGRMPEDTNAGMNQQQTATRQRQIYESRSHQTHVSGRRSPDQPFCSDQSSTGGSDHATPRESQTPVTFRPSSSAMAMYNSTQRAIAPAAPAASYYGYGQSAWPHSYTRTDIPEVSRQPFAYGGSESQSQLGYQYQGYGEPAPWQPFGSGVDAPVTSFSYPNYGYSPQNPQQFAENATSAAIPSRRRRSRSPRRQDDTSAPRTRSPRRQDHISEQRTRFTGWQDHVSEWRTRSPGRQASPQGQHRSPRARDRISEEQWDTIELTLRRQGLWRPEWD